MIEYRWSSARAVLLDEKGAIEVREELVAWAKGFSLTSEFFGGWKCSVFGRLTVQSYILLLATIAYPAHASGLSNIEFFPWGNRGTGSKKKGGKSYKEVVKKG